MSRPALLLVVVGAVGAAGIPRAVRAEEPAASQPAPAQEPALPLPPEPPSPQEKYETRITTRRSTEPQTEIRVTGKELRRQGVTNLAEALVLLPEVGSHENRRGGLPIDIRAARQRAVMIIVDGVTVDEPWNGNFDLASIPVTDIAEVRLSTAPASPLDGIGGSGGVIEVVTVGAIGRPLVAGQAQASTDKQGQLAATGRAAVGDLGVRVSAVGALSARVFEVELADGTGQDVDEAGRQATGTARVEQQIGRLLLRADLWGQRRSYVLAPDDELGAQVALVNREESFRLTLGAEGELAGTTLVARGYAQLLRRDVIYFTDATQDTIATDEFIEADREGLMAEGSRPLGGGWTVLGRTSIDTEQASARIDRTYDDGRSSVAAAAAGVTGSIGPVASDLALGAAIPLVGDASPWPEAKLSLTWAPHPVLTLRAIGARKGRLPTLRERFGPNIGNPDLGTERSTFGELGVTMRPHPWLTTVFAGYARQQDDLIRVADGRLENVGDILVQGLEARVETGEGKPQGGGVAYNFAHAISDDLGIDPLDFLPRHRVDVWARVAYRAHVGGWVRVRWTDDRVDLGTTLDAFTSVDVSAWARLGRGWLATVRGNNVNDASYLARAGLAGQGTTVVFTLEGRWE